jgi:hypothetical protein
MATVPMNITVNIDPELKQIIERMKKDVIKFKGRAKFWKEACQKKNVQAYSLDDLAQVYEALEAASVPVEDGTNEKRVKWLIEQWQRYESASK